MDDSMVDDKNIEEIYYTVREAAELLKVCPSTVRKYLRNEDLKGFKLKKNSGWRIKYNVLREFGGLDE